MKEKSLVAFTLAAQAAVGGYAVLAGLQLAAGAPVALLDLRSLAVLVLLVLLGMAASLLHLGAPQRAYCALVGLRSSWLSREVLAAALFAGCLVAEAGAALLWGPQRFPAALVLLVALAGLALVYCMARAYMLRTIGPWDTPAVLLSFLATSAVLGGLLALVLAPGAGPAALWLVVAAALVDIALGFWHLRPAWRPRYGAIRAPAVPSVALQALHVNLLAAGVLLACRAHLTGEPWLLPALGLAVLAEVANRVQFYRV